MSAEFDRNDLRGFFSALSNDTISPDEHARLERILSASREARQMWFLHCDIETGLADWAAIRNEQKNSPVSRLSATLKSTVWIWWSSAATAAIVFAALLLWPRAQSETASNGVAVLSRTVDLVGLEWGSGEKELAAGAVLTAGPLRLKSGAALIEFYSGARVVVEGPAEFELRGVNGAYLRSGRINAHVPPQARGFTVESPGMKVVDHGTDFGIALRTDTAPEVHVFEGKVEVAASGGASLFLKSGDGVRLETGVLKSIPADAKSFLAEAELLRRDAAGADQRFAAWREASSALAADPSSVIHYRLSNTVPTDRILKNAVASAQPESHGNIVGCEWTEGRWPGKRALKFRNESDRVRLIAAQPQNSVTLLAWVRVAALPHGMQSLLAADVEQVGALRWELSRSGQLRLNIGRDLGRQRLDWEAVESEEFMTPERLGRWVLLATTFDGSTIRHYGNGRLIGSGASFRPPALHIGAANLGNWLGPVLRTLPADMDEFAVLSRVMSAEEIRAYFESGKP